MSNFAGTAIVPTLSRIVLALAFVTVGYNKLFTEKTDFTAAEAAILQAEGVQVARTSTVVQAEPRRQIVPASFRQDEQGEQEPPEGAEPEAEITRLPQPPTAGEQTVEGGEEPPVGAEPGAGAFEEGDYTAKKMFVITLMCSEAGWPKPKYAAWLVALTEFVGGALLLVGFLSRVWGLGLAITMGCAFYLVAIGQLSVHASNPFLFAENIGSYQTVVTQLGLFVLAFGILLTGAGPVSLDRLLFGARGKKHLETGLAEEGVLGQGSSGGGRPV